MNKDIMYGAITIRMYENVTGNICPTHQIEYNDWFIGYVNWLEQQVYILSAVVSQNKIDPVPCEHDYSDGIGTGWHVCRNCGDTL